MIIVIISIIDHVHSRSILPCCSYTSTQQKKCFDTLDQLTIPMSMLRYSTWIRYIQRHVILYHVFPCVLFSDMFPCLRDLFAGMHLIRYVSMYCPLYWQKSNPNIKTCSWYTYPSEKYMSQLGWWNSQYMKINMSMYIYIYMYICMYVYIYIYICMCKYIYIYVCMYVYIYMNFQPYLGTFQVGTGPLKACIWNHASAHFSLGSRSPVCATHPDTWMQTRDPPCVTSS